MANVDHPEFVTLRKGPDLNLRETARAARAFLDGFGYNDDSATVYGPAVRRLTDTLTMPPVAAQPSGHPELTTLAEAQAWIRDQADGDGARCPCCTQLAKVYRRRLNAGMARSLIVMYRCHGLAWQDKTVTLSGVGAAARDESLLRYWCLLEEADATREDGGRAGWWRVTTRGALFVRDMLRVPAHAIVYDGRCLGLDDQAGRIGIRDALSRKFDYDELMRDAAGVAPPIAV